MSRPSVAGSMQGINWSIESGLVDLDVAEAAAQEIVTAIASDNKMIGFDHSQPKFGFTGYRIRGLESLTPKKIAKPSFDFPALMVVRDALAPFKDSALLAGRKAGTYDEGFVNITEPGGKVPSHRDNEPWSLVFVSLTAEVKAKIKHRDEPDYATVILRPGDAVRIVNPKASKQRPKHKFVNLSDFARISYGEYTTQKDR